MTSSIPPSSSSSSINNTNYNTTNTNITPNPPPSETNVQKTEALTAFTATLHSVGTNLEQPLRERAAMINSNASALDRQETELAAHTASLARDNAQWSVLADEVRDGLKEIGDVQNWAEVIERELLVLEDTVTQVEGRRKGQGRAGLWGDDDDDSIEGHGNEVDHEEEYEDGEGEDEDGRGTGGDGMKDAKGKRGWLSWW